MANRITTEEAAEELHTTPRNVRHIARKLELEPETIGKAKFFSPAQVRQMSKWIAENEYRRDDK